MSASEYTVSMPTPIPPQARKSTLTFKHVLKSKPD